MVELNSHAKARLAAVDARKTDERVGNCMRLVRKNLDMIEHEPHIKLKALVSLLCLYIVTELGHLPWKMVRGQAFKLFRAGLDEMKAKADEAAKRMEGPAND